MSLSLVSYPGHSNILVPRTVLNLEYMFSKWLWVNWMNRWMDEIAFALGECDCAWGLCSAYYSQWTLHQWQHRTVCWTCHSFWYLQSECLTRQVYVKRIFWQEIRKCLRKVQLLPVMARNNLGLNATNYNKLGSEITYFLCIKIIPRNSRCGSAG